MSWENSRVDMNIYSQGEIDRYVYSTCNICSVGCGCFIPVKDNQIVGIAGNPDHPTNRGRLGPKGENQWFANRSSDRLLTPMIRNRHGKLVPASWDDAMELFVHKTRHTLHTLGPDGVAIYSTGQSYLETYYTIAKIGRAGLRSHLLDANTRLCTATTEWCLLESFGSDGVPASFDDLDHTDTLFMIGHNVAETGTVLFERILQRKKRTGKPYIIVADVRKTITAEYADLFLQLFPGSNAALLNGLIHVMLRDGQIDASFIQNHTVGFDSMKKSVEPWNLEQTAKATGLRSALIEKAGSILGQTETLVSTTLQGTYQTVDATTTSVAVNNLHLIRGLIGKVGCGPLHMAGQPSSSGNRSVGGVSTYPGNRNPENPKHIKEMAELWNVSEEDLAIGSEKGIEEIVDLMEQGRIGVFWNIGTNPMVSLPNRRRARKAFEKTFVVVQDPFLTETTEVADIVLPAALWGEKEGTMENGERRINLLRKAVDPPVGVKSDFDIFTDFARRMDFKDKDGNPLISYRTPKECFEEWKRVSKGRPADMSGITYEKLEKYNGLRWPVNEEHPFGTPRLYSDFRFHTFPDDCQSYGKDLFTGRPRTRKEFEKLEANGRAILYPTHYIPPAERPSPDYPYWLTTGRLVWHWHTRTKTGRSPYLQSIAPNGYVEIHPDDAARLRLLPGEKVRIVSPRGSIEVPARIVDTVQRGLVFVPFHYGSFQAREAANELTVDFTDPVSKQPTFKQSACRIEKLRHFYTVQENEKLSDVAGKFGYTEEELAKANLLMPPYRADIGMRLEIPYSAVDVKIPPWNPYRSVENVPHFAQAFAVDHHQKGEG